MERRRTDDSRQAPDTDALPWTTQLLPMAQIHADKAAGGNAALTGGIFAMNGGKGAMGGGNLAMNGIFW
jgi:hypothetical protein